MSIADDKYNRSEKGHERWQRYHEAHRVEEKERRAIYRALHPFDDMLYDLGRIRLPR